ncbi:MAG: DUF4437 domain-containing protein [Myxococcota bacterium]
MRVLPVSSVQWEALNPARGDRSPQAGTLWGDRNGEVPTGFLVRFVDGFSSPPHIHNVTYRGVVLSGRVHNDDPDAAVMWMPPGAYWTQPAGEVHITAAKGDENVAFIEIDQGPYLVRPPEQTFDNGERPVNLDPSNLIWLDASNTPWIDASGPTLTHLWGAPGEGQRSGSLLKLPAGFNGQVTSSDRHFRAVVVQGRPTHQVPGRSAPQSLPPGSTFDAQGPVAHQLTVGAGEDSILYVSAMGPYTVR